MPRRPDLEQKHQNLFRQVEGESDVDGLKLIAHDQIEIKAQPRTILPPEELQELSDNIRALQERGEGIEGTGVLQPLLVVRLETHKTTAGKTNDEANTDQAKVDQTNATDSSMAENERDLPSPSRYRYRLVAGERRYRASQAAGVLKVPAIVLPLHESTQENAIFLAQIIENLQRRDLAPLDEANALQRLMQEQELSVRDTATLLGKSKSYVSDRTALLKMRPEVQAMLSQRADAVFHAREINRVEEEQLRNELIQATLEGASVSEVRQRITSQQAEEHSDDNLDTTPVTNQPTGQHAMAKNAVSQNSAQQEVNDQEAHDQGVHERSLNNQPSAPQSEAVEIQSSSTQRLPSQPLSDEASVHKVSVHPDTALDSDLTNHSASSTNPIRLDPAVTLVAHAVRLLQADRRLASTFGKDIESELMALEEQIAQLKSAL